MATHNLIAVALERVQAKADAKNKHVIHSSMIARSDRQLLISTGWLQEIIRGWYMLVRPDVATGDSAAWYANFWDFVEAYLRYRFNDDYCLSAEASLDLHIENPAIPKQLIVIAHSGAGFRSLLYNTSLMIYADTKNFPTEIIKKQNINVMSLAYALCKVSPSYFQKNPRDAELALRTIKTPDELSRIIIRYQFKTAAARLIGAYQFLNDNDMAERLTQDLKTVGMMVTPNNPFIHDAPFLKRSRLISPYAGRIPAMWAEARNSVVDNFPEPYGLPKNAKDYLQQIDEIYQYDAYNSLSIEGYQVTAELINKIKNEAWDPLSNEYDNNAKNAMAAKGYYEAFQQVKHCIEKIIHGENAAKVIKDNLQKWYQQLFAPSAQAGIVPADALFGYRNDRVFIRNSRHSPPPKEAVLDAMEAFFDCLHNEPHAGVNAVLGHYFFVFIHPYMDGNGRLARFLMNALLASGGYPWTVVRVENRNRYISILENTHLQFNMVEFTRFIREEMEKTRNWSVPRKE